MTRFACFLIVGLTFIALPGCGGSGESTNVAQDADQAAMDAYEAAAATEGAAMNETE